MVNDGTGWTCGGNVVEDVDDDDEDDDTDAGEATEELDDESSIGSATFDEPEVVGVAEIEAMAAEIGVDDPSSSTSFFIWMMKLTLDQGSV